VQCAPGSITSTIGQVHCFEMLRLMERNALFQVACSPCGLGYYAATRGTSECSSCQPGKTELEFCHLLGSWKDFTKIRHLKAIAEGATPAPSLLLLRRFWISVVPSELIVSCCSQRHSVHRVSPAGLQDHKTFLCAICVNRVTILLCFDKEKIFLFQDRFKSSKHKVAAGSANPVPSRRYPEK
jgi:hypothetical protein